MANQKHYNWLINNTNIVDIEEDVAKSIASGSTTHKVRFEIHGSSEVTEIQPWETVYDVFSDILGYETKFKPLKDINLNLLEVTGE